MGTLLRQRYSPDTCGCVMVQEFPDRDDTSDWRVPLHSVPDQDGNMVTSLTRCPAHQGLSEDTIARCILKDADSEQKRKNGLIRELMLQAAIPGLTEEIETEDYEMEDHPQLGRIPRVDPATDAPVRIKAMEFKPGVAMRHEFTGTGANRGLEMWVMGVTVTPAMRATLNQCAVRCGSPARPVVIKAIAETT